MSQHHVSEVIALFPPFVPTCDFLYSDLFSFFFIFSCDYLVNKDFNFATVYSMPIQLPFIAPRG